MQLSKSDKSYLWDMIEAAKDIISFTSGLTFDEFDGDKKTRYAVERQMLVIGEAANHISSETQNRYTFIPWSNMIGLRNIIAHDYGEVLSKRIWKVAIDNIPQLLDDLQKILDSKLVDNL